MDKLRYLPGVSTLELDRTKCTGCAMRLSVCPHGVFALDDGKARIDDLDACMECGACARNCSAEAVRVQAGVGCATAIIIGALRGSEPDCGVSDNDCCCR